MKVVYLLIDKETNTNPCGTDYHLIIHNRKTTKITSKVITWKKRMETFKNKQFDIVVEIDNR